LSDIGRIKPYITYVNLLYGCNLYANIFNMKIAILGKGGAGKSSISWLISNYLSQVKKIQTLAIDGDHNMDLCTNFDQEYENYQYFKDFNKEFRELVGMQRIGMWNQYFNFTPIIFQYPNDTRINKYYNKIGDNLDLMIIGLGDKENIYDQKCGHGLSAPLKYMMPTLNLAKNSAIILDSVAGVDMANYGLYYGFDNNICVVEGHKNSIKVAMQLRELFTLQGLKLSFILNKYDSDNQLLNKFEDEYKNEILGQVPLDKAILNYNFQNLNSQTLQSLESIFANLNHESKVDSYNMLKKFEMEKK
jgi:CO dehydrogenase maturation factor